MRNSEMAIAHAAQHGDGENPSGGVVRMHQLMRGQHAEHARGDADRKREREESARRRVAGLQNGPGYDCELKRDVGKGQQAERRRRAARIRSLVARRNSLRTDEEQQQRRDGQQRPQRSERVVENRYRKREEEGPAIADGSKHHCVIPGLRIFRRGERPARRLPGGCATPAWPRSGS